ncbi:DEAD/DEAH box helicase family protein [bacterium]|nr:DEAD/DEAH box helicase family protein [bacterium]
MAKLFRKEYNIHANSWYFRDNVIKTEKDDLLFWKSIDQKGNYNFIFFAQNHLKKYFSGIVRIKYDAEHSTILEHYCSEDLDKSCNHYLTVLDYAYKYLSDEVLNDDLVEVYSRSDLKYDENFQARYAKTYITISELFNPNSDKLRLYFHGYEDYDLRLISYLKAGKEIKKTSTKDIQKAEKQMNVFREEELIFLAELNNCKCSYSSKNNFFSIYKNNLNHILPHLRLLQDKIFIAETGDKIIWQDNKLPIHFIIQKLSPEKSILKAELGQDVSAIFYFNSIYVFFRNDLYKVDLPFKSSIFKGMLEAGILLSTKDLIYYHAIVAKQLSLSNYYLDMDEEIELPAVFDNRPKIYFHLSKEGDAVVMDGRLVYDEDISIPLSIIRLNANLINYEYAPKRKAWFYIPPLVFSEVFEFLDQLPNPQYQRLESNSQLYFEGALSIDLLKKAIFELSNEDWNIQLSDELKKDFVYKVNLQAEIKTQAKEEINWFKYEVTYKYKDFAFTHNELKKFFNSKQKFMTLADGRLIFFENKEVFTQMENLLNKSEITKDQVYSMHYENIPYFFRLVNDNPAIKLYGDKYIDSMSRDLISGKLKNSPEVPFFLNHIMRSYQKSGYKWLKMLEYYKLNGILADEMGLGKTIQAISVLSEVPAGQKSIIICPKTLIYNWAAEFKKFKLDKSFIIYEGNKQERQDMLEKVNFDILIASYSIIQNDIEFLGEKEFYYVILDEAQHIKNVSALRTKAIKKLRSQHRLALTGTPLENDISEIWSLFDFLLPNYLMNKQRFVRTFSGIENIDRREDLNKMISPFILRRKKSDVLLELPNKQEQIAFCKLSPVQEKVYMQLIDNITKSYFNPDNSEKINYINILTALMKLRQICDHPHLVEKSIKDDFALSSKIELLQELVLDAIDSDRKILIFSQFIGMLQIIKKMLEKHGIPYEYLDGKTKDRQGHIENFNNNTKIKVFLISLKTGGYGLNLTAADTVILTDPWWNPMIENQAIDRAHRIGQTKKVQVYKLISKGTVEEKIISLQNSKKELFEQIIENNENVLKSMSVDQIKDLFNYEI